MQSWHDLVKSYPDAPDRKDYAKALWIIDVLISDPKHLAQFEIEWMSQTLLFKPVQLFETISSKRLIEDWYKTVSDSFKVLAKLIDNYRDVIDSYKDGILKLCMLPCYAKTKKDAILCLISLIKTNEVNVPDEVVLRIVLDLERSTNCKAALAQVVGIICRCYPVKVQEHYGTIWMIYFKMLQSKNNTDVVTSSVLQGIDDLFTYFGDKIQTNDLNTFYDMMSRKYFKIHKCIDVLLSILKHHARLFKEKLTADKALRLFLWQIETESGMDVLTNVYKLILPNMQNIGEILNSEVLPRVESSSPLVKRTALSIIVQAKPGAKYEVPSLFSGIDLEFKLKARKLSNEKANEVARCIESSIDNRRTMLLTAIMFYDNLPTSKRHLIVSDGILKGCTQTRQMALETLLKMCLQDNLDKYYNVWRVLFDKYTEPPTTAMVIFRVVFHHILEILGYLIQDSDKAYAEVRPVFHLMRVLLCVLSSDMDTPSWCAAVRPTLVHLARRCGLHPVRMLNDIPLPDEDIYSEQFHRYNLFTELIATLPAPGSNALDDTLSALQIIFLKDGTEPKVFIEALWKLDELIRTEKNNLDTQKLAMILKTLKRLKSNRFMDHSTARMFQKDLALFLGKYSDLAPIERFSEDIYILKFKNKLTLNVPNIIEGTTYKIDLKRVLQLSLFGGEGEALYALLVILSANMCDRSDPSVQEATIRVIHALFRAKGRESEMEVGVYPALLMCNTVACVQTIMKCITEEPCVEVRRKLSGCLEVLLTHDPGSDVTSQLVQSVAEQALFMIGTDEPSTVDIGLDITTAFMAAIKDNNGLIVDTLPIILVQTSNISSEKSGIFETASNLFIEKLDLFTKDAIKSTIIKILEKYTINGDMQLQTNIPGFIKRVINMREDTINIVDELLDLSKNLTVSSPQFVKIVALLAFSCVTFDFSPEVRKKIIGFDNGLFLEELLKISYDDSQVYKMNAVLLFLKEYATELLEDDVEKTLQCLCNLIENMVPNTVNALKKPIADCLTFYKTIFNDSLQLSYSKWSEKLINSEKITSYLEGNIMSVEFSEKTSEAILALKIMTELDFLTENARSWTSIIIADSTAEELKWGQVYLSDILTVSGKCMSRNEFHMFVGSNFAFVTTFVNVYFERLIEEPLNKTDEYYKLLAAVVEHYTKMYREEQFDKFMDFVNYLWPNYEESRLSDEILSVVLNLLSLPRKMDLDACPMKWTLDIVNTKILSNLDQNRIISSLPSGEEFSAYYREFVSCLPVCLSEIQGHLVGTLRAVLDSLANNGDMTLLDIVITLAGGDSSKGWWDYAIEACMKVLARKHDINIVNEAYIRARRSASLDICNRIFLPLLRHSSRKFVHDYISSIVPDLLTRDGFKEPTNTGAYRKLVFNYALKLNLLKLAFDKLSADSLQCGILNERAGSPKPWHFMEETCKFCVTLSTKVKCPDGAFAEVQETCLWLQCSAYNCLTAAICKRKPNKKLYAQIFKAQAWANIVDNDVYIFEIGAHSTCRGSRPSKRSTDELATSAASTGTVRSRLFLTTLSENPLQYDMIPDEEELDDGEDNLPEFEANVLNDHGCLSTVTSLLEHASTLEHTDWRTTLVDVITSDVIVNVKWLLAQAVCNAEESLKPHAAILIPALFHLIADTPQNTSRLTLNNLHIDILSTIINWNVPDVSTDSHIDSTINYLITTCMVYKKSYNIEKRLLNVLNGVLNLYGSQVKVQWDLFTSGHDVSIKAVTSNLPILERLLKNKVAIPELLPTIFTNTDSKLFTNKLAEISGLALALADSDSRDVYLARFWAILAPLKSTDVGGFIKLLFYAQRHCRQCCDMSQFKIITNYATKMERSKCLSIMSTYLEHASCFDPYFIDMFETISLCELLEGDLLVVAMKLARSSLRFMEKELKVDVMKKVAENCGNYTVKIRKEAYSTFLKAFQDLFQREDHHPSKRRAMDSTPLLDSMDSTETLDGIVIQKIFHGIFDDDEQVSAMVIDGVECCLSKDVTVRFAELFYLMVYQNFLSKYHNVDITNCGTKLLQLLFKDLRENEAFNSARLREDGLPQSILKVYEAITTKPRTRTVLRSSVTYRQTVVKAPIRREIDVQMKITDILEIFLQLSKANSQVSLELCGQMMKCLRATSRRFDLDAVISKQLCVILKKEPNCLTPLVLEACRVFISRVSSVQGFKESVHDLSRGIRNSEGHVYTNILYEDLVLRSGDKSQFIFRLMREDPTPDVVMTEEPTPDSVMKEEVNPDVVMKDKEFSLEGVINVFGTLSNWNNIKIQERQHLEDSLPPLWTKENDFAIKLRQYFNAAQQKLDCSLWFNKMVASYYKKEVTENIFSWLKETDTWPARHFVTSAIIEAILLHQNDSNSVTTDLRASDCLAEWAARLMIRSSFRNLSSCGDDEEQIRSFSLSDLVWCAEANRRGLPSLALQCIDRNKDSLLDVEVLPWVKERVIAYRTIGLRENKHSLLQKALGAAETQSKRFSVRSSLDTNVSMQQIILRLHHDLNSISVNKLDNVMQNVNTLVRQNDGELSSTNGQVLKSLYEDAMIFYDELWSEDKATQNTIIQRQTEIIGRMLDYNLGKNYDMLVSVLLNRIAYSEATISEAAAKIMLDQIYRVFHKLDSFSVAILKKVVAVLPNVDEKYLNKLQDASVDDCKEFFHLICDVNYALLQYCEGLWKNVFDETEWEKTFETMKNMVFSITYGGSDYQSLNTLKNRLYALQDMVDIEAKANNLKSIIEELKPKSQRSNLRLSQVTPRLCLPSTLEDKRRELQSLLRLPPNVYVVKFCEQVSVITDSIRRPCVIKALLSNGSSRRYICKSGEPLLKDVAVQRVAAILPLVHPSIQVRSYNVTPLTEDSAIIEFLEDHVRLRDTMKESYDFNSIVVDRANDKLILAPSLALEQYNDMCDKVPPYILRSAIENNCSCVKEFIDKKQTFEETLCSMTLLNWMFGVGDRHLENILLCERACALGGVDWACALSYSREPPPARLTRNLLAMAGAAVVESRLQNILSSLRDSRKLLEVFIRTSFHWLGPNFNELKHVTAILEGSAVSYDVARACIESSDKKYKDNYLKLLDEVFVDFPKKETYSVEEQVSCLLHHCTDPRILSVTPQGWEPWL